MKGLPFCLLAQKGGYQERTHFRRTSPVSLAMRLGLTLRVAGRDFPLPHDA